MARPVVLAAVLFIGIAVAHPVSAAQPPPVIPERQPLVQAGQPAWKKEWDQARELARQQRYADALVLYRRLAATGVDVPQARREMAFLLLATGEAQEAASILEELAARFPDDVELLAGLARAYQAGGRHAEALAALEHALRLRPADPELARLAGESLLALDRLDQAFTTLAPYLNHHPEDRAFRRRLLETAVAHGRDDLARDLAAALAAPPDTPVDLLVLAAQVHQRLGLVNPAADYWQRAQAAGDDSVAGHRFLADYYSQRHEAAKAYEELRRLWELTTPTPELGRRLGLLAEQLGHFHQARRYLEEALAGDPTDLAAVEGLIRLAARAGDQETTLAMLERYFALVDRPAASRLRQAAGLYALRGALRQAIDLYRALLAENPDDPEILEILAHDLLAVGEPHQALAMWRHLARLSPDRLDIHRAMADLLQRLGRHEELAPVLARIVALDPGDTVSALHLAELRLAAGERTESLALLRSALATADLPADALRRRARLAGVLGLSGHALADYQRLWHQGDRSVAVLTGYLANGAACGDLAALAAVVDAAGARPEPAVRLALVRALLQAGLAEDGVGYIQTEHRGPAMETLARAGLLPEAEALGRTWLAATGTVEPVLRLAHLALVAGDQETAGRWLRLADRLGPDETLVTVTGLGRVSAAWYRVYLAGRLAVVSGATRRAGDLAADLVGRLAAGGSPDPAAVAATAALALDGGREDLLGRLVATLDDGTAPRLHATLLALALVTGHRQVPAVQHELGVDRGLLQGCARDLVRFGRADLAEALTGGPLGGAAGLDLARRRLAAGDGEAALAVLGDGPTAFVTPAILRGRALATAGRCAQAVAVLDGLPAGIQDRFRYPLGLLRAGCLWTSGQREAALAHYRRLAGLERGEDREPPAGRRWWPVADSEPWTDVLQAQEVGERPADLTDVLRHLPEYRWQRTASMYLAARGALAGNAHHRAVLAYRRLLAAVGPTPPLLMDLAAVYHHLGRLQDEAGLYGRLAEQWPDYPGVAAGLERIRRGRRPQLAVTGDWQWQEGRDDHLAMEVGRGGVRLTVSPRLQHQLGLEAEHLAYRSTLDSDQRERGDRIVGRYTTSFGYGMGLDLRLGGHRLHGGGETTTVWAARLDGELGDRLSGYLALDRDLVTDTMVSLRRGITRDRFTAGGWLEPVARFRLGGSYFFSDYTDGNLTEGYGLHLTATLATLPNLLQCTYSYDLVDSRDADLPGVVLAGASGGRDHPYWTPRNYWLNNLALYYKHELAPPTAAGEAGAFFDLRCSLGHDSDGHARQEIGGSLALPLTSRWRLRATTTVVASPAERQRHLMLRLTTSW